MAANWILAAVSVLAMGFALWAAATLRRVKGQLSEMTEILDEIASGNGNRRILSPTNALTAPLAFRINEIVVSYEEQLAALRRTEQTNKQLMTSLSHDVRTPLTTLIGYLDAVCKGTAADGERETFLRTARSKALDLKEYIDVLFDWFKLGSDEFALKNEPVELVGLTRSVLIDWIPILEEKGIDYSIDIPEQPVSVRLDPDGCIRVLNNLIGNILSHAQASFITLRLYTQDGTAFLSLRDNGVGIGQEDLSHIFERLYKCDRGRSRKGSGLGLSIVRQLVEKMGGSIQAESTPGAGTTFFLAFPLQ